MKIALVSSAVPFVRGGYRFIVDWLASKLIEAGHRVEIVWIPCSDDPRTYFAQMTAFRLIELEKSVDRVITFRPPAHVIKHSNKIVWFIHHFRGFYDLWDTTYKPVPDTPYWRSFRDSLMIADTNALQEARAVFSNSKTVANRLRHFNGTESEVLYPPIFASERFYNDAYGSEIVCICRFEHHKRQHLLVEAMRHVRSPVRLRLAGDSMSASYFDELKARVARYDLADKVTINCGWISEGEKTSLLSTALAAAYVPLDEDSYGYPTIEAAHAHKATLSVSDAGGVGEFVSDGETGILTAPDPKAIGEAFDRLWSDRKLARRLGNAAHGRISDMNITWEHVIARLLS